MRDTLAVLICTCLWGGAYPQDSDSPPTSAPPSLPSHADVQIVYTDEFMKVIEKYGITNDDIMYVTNKYKEGKPPTITKILKDKETGDEKVIKVNLKNFISGGHVTDLTSIPEPEAPEVILCGPFLHLTDGRSQLLRELLDRYMNAGIPTKYPQKYTIEATRSQFIPVPFRLLRLGTRPVFIRVNRRQQIPLDPALLPNIVPGNPDQTF